MCYLQVYCPVNTPRRMSPAILRTRLRNPPAARASWNPSNLGGHRCHRRRPIRIVFGPAALGEASISHDRNERREPMPRCHRTRHRARAADNAEQTGAVDPATGSADRRAPRPRAGYDGRSCSSRSSRPPRAPPGIEISKLLTTLGVITLDPGFTNTGSTTSAITYIDGDAGILRYRGYPIEQLAESLDLPGDQLPADLRRAAHRRPSSPRSPAGSAGTRCCTRT